MEATQEHLENLIFLLSSGTLLSLLATKIAGQAGFYRRLSKDPYGRTPSFTDVSVAFGLYFLLQITLLALVVYLFNAIQTGKWLMFPQSIPKYEKIWMSSLSMWLSAGGLWFFCFLFQPSALKTIKESEVNEKGSGPLYNFFFGAMTWLVTYPIVFTLSQLTGAIVQVIFPNSKGEQIALTLLKSSFNHPFQFIFYILSIISITPIVEEFLFRGILQRWLITKTGPLYGIIFTSVCFSTLHLTASQGAFNLELLPPLFVLSCYLGYLYERQRSLWAPIGLHATFNLVSCLLALIQDFV